MLRVPSKEWLDEDIGEPAEICRSFDDLWRINRWLGGVSGCLHLLDRYFARRGNRPVRILDVGAGDSRLAAHLRAELARRHIPAEFVALDRRANHLKNGNPSSEGVRKVAADVFSLPFRNGSFEVVICNLFLHHFSGREAEELLCRMGAIASEAVLINDLERHVLPYVFIRLAWPFARSRITRHDGAASVRQAYTKDELEALASRAGFAAFDVERLPAYRLGLMLWKF
ncbi:MAG TPA: methyltransferase domain-containing protein [Terriglobia bacterium]|jgi:SAM-dependent methyltransferase|nr:methyltransferase domain-containing protein [Terriglobia bacterium]